MKPISNPRCIRRNVWILVHPKRKALSGHKDQRYHRAPPALSSQAPQTPQTSAGIPGPSLAPSPEAKCQTRSPRLPERANTTFSPFWSVSHPAHLHIPVYLLTPSRAEKEGGSCQIHACRVGRNPAIRRWTRPAHPIPPHQPSGVLKGRAGDNMMSLCTPSRCHHWVQ